MNTSPKTNTTALSAIIFALTAIAFPMSACADTETVDGIEWTYRIVDGTAVIGDGTNAAINLSLAGEITIPSVLGGGPVSAVDDNAFDHDVTIIRLPEKEALMKDE